MSSETIPPRPLSARFVPTRLALCSAAVFGTMGLYLPFWPVWLERHAISAEGIGTLVALGYFIRTFASPAATMLADHTGDRRMVLIGASSLMAASFLFFHFTGSYVPILIVSVFALTGMAPQVPLKESIIMGYVAREGYDYGRIRLWGSLAFIVMTIAGGYILSWFGASGILWGMIAFALLMLLACIALPPDPRKGEAAESPLRMSAVWALVRQPTFLVFMGTISLTMAAHAVIYAFGTLNWLRLGYSNTFIGALWALGVIAEIVLFAFSVRVLKRISPLQLMLVAGAAAIVRWMAMAFEPHWILLIPLQCLHAFTFGALHLAAMHYISRFVPVQVSATAMGLLAATSGGIVMGLATVAAGPLYEAYHALAFLFAAGLGAAGLMLALWLMHLHKDEVPA